MIGVILVTHGALAVEFKKALEHIVGSQDAMLTVCIHPDDDVRARREEIAMAIKQIDTGEGVIILTDMFGGTPSNIAIAESKLETVEVIAGINLPLLVKLAKIRENLPLQEVVKEAQKAGKKYINIASAVLNGTD